MATADLSRVSTLFINYSRLCKLLIDGGTRVLREVFDKIHPPTSLRRHLLDPANHKILKTLKYKKVLYKEQWDKLYPAGGSTVTSSSFDITLLCLLLRNICHLKTPSAGWNKPPLPTSTNTEDDVVRIKLFRNNLYGHIKEAAISDSDFTKYWKDIKRVLVRLGGQSYKAEIEELLVVSTDPEDGKYAIQCLEEWVKNEEKIMKALHEEAEKTRHELAGKMDEVGQHVVAEIKGHMMPHASKKRKLTDPLVYSQNLKCVMKNQLEIYQECNMLPIIKEKKIEDIFTNPLIKQRGGKSPKPDIKGRGGILLGDEGNANPKSILIDGKPGIGKSIFCRKLVYDWTQDDIFDTTARSDHPDIKFTFLLTFRQLNMSTEKQLDLKELLNHCSMLDGRTQIKDTIIEHIIQHPEQLLIVLDGYDEYKDCSNIVNNFEESFRNDPKIKMPVTALFSKLMKKKILRDSVVIVTSRIGEADEIVKHAHFDRHVQIADFSEKQVIEYVEKYFKSNEDLKTKAIASIKDNQDYLSFGCVPLTCFLMCVYMEVYIPKSGEGFPETLTAFYSKVVGRIERNNKALKADQLDDSTAALHVQTIRNKLSELAASLTVHKQYSFDEDDLKKLNLSEKELSYIKSSSLLFSEAGDVRKSQFSEIQHLQYSFIHATVQEYFAARHFVLKNEIPAHNTVSSMVFQFMAGSMQVGKHSKLMDKLLKSIEGSGKEQSRVSLNCLYEYGDRGFAKGVIKQNQDNIYWNSDGEIHLSNIDYKVVVMLVDTLTTLNREQIPSNSSVFYSLYVEDSPSFRLGVETLCDSLIEDFCEIDELELFDCNIDDEGAQCLIKCLPHLFKLNLPFNKLTDKCFVSIAPHCKHLFYLDITSNCDITDKGLIAIAQYCNNLTDLHISYNYDITDKGLIAIAQYCNNLTNLVIEHCYKITDEGLKSIAQYCNNLTNLDMSYCSITGESLESIEPQYTQLTYLLMDHNLITDKGVLQILRCCDKLTDLHLNRNKIADEGLKSIAQYCNNLTYLDISHNYDITDKGLIAIAQYCNNLATLDLSRNKITDKAIVSIAPFYKNLKILSINKMFYDGDDDDDGDSNDDGSDNDGGGNDDDDDDGGDDDDDSGGGNDGNNDDDEDGNDDDSGGNEDEDLPHYNNHKIFAKGLVSIIRCYDKLTYLDFSYNDITDNDIESVLQLLTHRDKFKLNVRYNKITDECKERVREVLKDKPHIELLM